MTMKSKLITCLINYNNNNALGRHRGKTTKCIYVNNNLVNRIITMTLNKDIFRVAVFNNQI